jgi:hypothetical protein
MIFKLRRSQSSVLRPRVTPDPDQAAELQRRMSELAYHPENGFHRDRRQDRIARHALRLVAQR